MCCWDAVFFPTSCFFGLDIGISKIWDFIINVEGQPTWFHRTKPVSWWWCYAIIISPTGTNTLILGCDWKWVMDVMGLQFMAVFIGRMMIHLWMEWGTIFSDTFKWHNIMWPQSLGLKTRTPHVLTHPHGVWDLFVKVIRDSSIFWQQWESYNDSQVNAPSCTHHGGAAFHPHLAPKITNALGWNTRQQAKNQLREQGFKEISVWASSWGGWNHLQGVEPCSSSMFPILLSCGMLWLTGHCQSAWFPPLVEEQCGNLILSCRGGVREVLLPHKAAEGFQTHPTLKQKIWLPPWQKTYERDDIIRVGCPSTSRRWLTPWSNWWSLWGWSFSHAAPIRVVTSIKAPPWRKWSSGSYGILYMVKSPPKQDLFPIIISHYLQLSIPWYPFISQNIPNVFIIGYNRYAILSPNVMVIQIPHFFTAVRPRFCADSAASLLSGGPMAIARVLRLHVGITMVKENPGKLEYHPSNYNRFI